ncbi:MAG TPA: transposase [Candidatus Binatia bacterium]|nr:transposase [Candidatus Binatia bacterium]
MPAHPVHVTLRAGAAIRCLRAPRVYPLLRIGLGRASRERFRVLQFTVQDDHVHLIVEADDSAAFVRGLRGLTIRLAKAVNRALGRRGAVWADRFHARALATPRAVRHALVYVLMNWRKHRGADAAIDPCSSGAWFRGWREPIDPVPERAPVVAARTWLAAIGWRRHGLIALTERPRGAGSAQHYP